MERRSSNRIVVMLAADIISKSISYPGFLEIATEFPGVNFYTYAGIIENISADGMMITIPEKSKLDLSSGSALEIGFQLPSGERVNLNCMVCRFQDKRASQDLEHRIGIVIIDPPPVYSKFFAPGLN